MHSLPSWGFGGMQRTPLIAVIALTIYVCSNFILSDRQEVRTGRGEVAESLQNALPYSMQGFTDVSV